MKEPIRILHFIPGFNYGGIESRFMDWHDRIDKSKIQFDLLTYDKGDNLLLEKFKDKGGNVYHIMKPSLRCLTRYYKRLKELMQNNNYAAIHCHSLDKSLLILAYALKADIRTRILHARTSSFGGAKYRTIRYLLMKTSKLFATDYFAVSKLAGSWAFGDRTNKSIVIVNNGINMSTFQYNKHVRNVLREQYDLNRYCVIGHVGRFTYAKNHKLIIDVFSAICKRDPNYRLILIGDGPLRESVEDEAKRYGLSDKVFFIGYTEDIPQYLSMMDVFLFPSIYEGLPGTLVEAQAIGLPCVISDAITDEICITDLIKPISLSKPKEYWAERLMNINKNRNRQIYSQIVAEKGYDVQDVVKKLEEFYIFASDYHEAIQ